MSTGVKVLIVAPFWGIPSHVGVYRVERFVRWLHACGHEVTMIRAGTTDRVAPAPWGTEVTIRDPIGLYRDPEGPPVPVWRRKPNRVRRLAAHALFSPDPTIVWARRAGRHPLVLDRGAGARWVMASSPPESAHVAAAELAARLEAKLLVDLRDGWLDEPNKPFLTGLPLRKWHEGRLEARSLAQAERVLVTSDGWWQQLTRRYPRIAPKVHVLTNGYPLELLDPPTAQPGRSPIALTREVLRLLYTGQFTNSRSTQRPRLLLEPLWQAARRGGTRGHVDLIGNLSPEDLAEIATWGRQLATVGWEVQTHEFVPRAEALTRVRRAHGLLLLSASDAAIPSKTFEYLASGHPILTITRRDGALWNLGEHLPQMFVADPADPSGWTPQVDAFLAACVSATEYPIPAQFTDAALAQRFLSLLDLGASTG
jgi:glycosyltransferase involved in cell wall biosynthesis